MYRSYVVYLNFGEGETPLMHMPILAVLKIFGGVTAIMGMSKTGQKRAKWF